MRYLSWSTLLVCIISVFNPGMLRAGNNAGGAFSVWPDTGQKNCYDDDGNLLNPCPAEKGFFYGQDAQYQGPTRSYTVIGGGTMIKDNITKLIWERKQNKDNIKNYNNPHDADNTYTWCDTNPETNGGDKGGCGLHNTESFIAALNSSKFGGYSDWRMPTLKELSTLLDFSEANPIINTSFFSNTMSAFYWSATTNAGFAIHAWLLHFKDGFNYGNNFYGNSNKIYRYHVRAVRGGQAPIKYRFIDNNDGTVTDTVTCLQWEKTALDRNNDGIEDKMTWEEALYECEHMVLAGHNDWRLPSKNELLSIVDYSKYFPCIDTSFFTTPHVGFALWTSTTSPYLVKTAHYVELGSGFFDIATKIPPSPTANRLYVRAVRGSQCVTSGDSENTILSWLILLLD